MKLKLIFSFALSALLLVGCTPEEFDSVPNSSSVLTSLSGTWTLRSVTQKDESAELRNSPFVTLDLTPLFPYNQYKLTLNGSGTASGDYTAVPGAAPKIIRSNTGKWQVDDVTNPKLVSFINGTGTRRGSL